MTQDEAMQLPERTIVQLRDGKLGILTHWWDTAGVTVPGEEQIREIPYSCLENLGDRRLRETL